MQIINVGFSDLRVECLIGLYDFERTNRQEVFVDASWQILPDQMVDYTEVATFVEKILQEGSFFLIEKAAFEIAVAIKKSFPVRIIKICLKKPRALEKAKEAFAEVSL